MNRYPRSTAPQNVRHPPLRMTMTVIKHNGHTRTTGIGAGAATQSRQPRCLPPPDRRNGSVQDADSFVVLSHWLSWSARLG